MKTRIVRIGNSQGVRIPKPLLDQSGIVGEVELVVQDGQIIIRGAEKPRADWARAFRSMAEVGDDQLLDPEIFAGSSWDDEEWEW
jgi:antitoxin MazE